MFACAKAAGVAPDEGLYGAALDAARQEEDWAEVYGLLFAMRADGAVAPDGLRASHKSMWRRAKRELDIK